MNSYIIGNSSDEDKEPEFMLNGADYFLTKPIMI